MAQLALDFGTSNTAAVVPGHGTVALEAGETTMPTALFFDPYAKQPMFGHAAVNALIDGQEGRFLRALKSVLGNPLLREKRMLGGERTTLLDVVARFLKHVKVQAESQFQGEFDTVLSGRPVRFHSRNDAYNAQAVVDLTEAYTIAGFRDVSFMDEPEAAALACGGVATGYGLVVDIGGGTSDYSVFRGQGDAIEVISNYGIRLGGTDFDRMLNIDRVMPALGMGSMVGNEIGPGQNEAPKSLFRDLATWEKIPFQYSAQIKRDAGRMAKLAIEPKPWARLMEVLEMELAHEIAHAVEKAKISANSGHDGGIRLDFIEKGMRLGLSQNDLNRVLAESAMEIGTAAREALNVAGIAPDQVTRVVMVGGSSLMQVIEYAIRGTLPGAQIDRSDAFTAIVDGLAIAAGRKLG